MRQEAILEFQVNNDGVWSGINGNEKKLYIYYVVIGRCCWIGFRGEIEEEKMKLRANL